RVNPARKLVPVSPVSRRCRFKISVARGGVIMWPRSAWVFPRLSIANSSTWIGIRDLKLVRLILGNEVGKHVKAVSLRSARGRYVIEILFDLLQRPFVVCITVNSSNVHHHIVSGSILS